MKNQANEKNKKPGDFSLRRIRRTVSFRKIQITGFKPAPAVPQE